MGDPLAITRKNYLEVWPEGAPAYSSRHGQEREAIERAQALGPGTHEIRIDGGVYLTVTNTDGKGPEFVYTTTSEYANTQPLNGATVTGEIWIWYAGSSREFFLDGDSVGKFAPQAIWSGELSEGNHVFTDGEQEARFVVDVVIGSIGAGNIGVTETASAITGGGTFSPTVTRTGGNGPVSVTYTVSGLVSASGALSWSDGETGTKSVDISVPDSSGTVTFTLSDARRTDEERLSVPTIAEPTWVLTASSTANPSTVLTVDNRVVAYGRSSFKFTVRASSVQGSNLNFAYTTYDLGSGVGYAEAGTDYTATSGTGTIAAGSIDTQITIPISYASEPDGGRDVFGFRVTDGDGAVSTGKAAIIDAIHVNDFDFTVSGNIHSQVRRDQSGSWENLRVYIANDGGASARMDSTALPAVGRTALIHEIATSTGRQGTDGVEWKSGTVNCGDIFDGETYYWKVWIKFASTFNWEGVNYGGQSASEKIKCGRWVPNPNPSGLGFSTPYLHADKFYWGDNWPTSGNAHTDLYADFDPINGSATPGADAWREVIFVQKRSTAYKANNGAGWLVVDGEVIDSVTGVDWTDTSGTASGPTTVRITNCGLFSWFQNQIGINASQLASAGLSSYPDGPTGGDIQTCEHVGTRGVWPSAKYEKPSEIV